MQGKGGWIRDETPVKHFSIGVAISETACRNGKTLSCVPIGIVSTLFSDVRTKPVP